MGGATIEVEVRPTDVLRQQDLPNGARNEVSSYVLIAIDLPEPGEFEPYGINPKPLLTVGSILASRARRGSMSRLEACRPGKTPPRR